MNTVKKFAAVFLSAALVFAVPGQHTAQAAVAAGRANLAVGTVLGGAAIQVHTTPLVSTPGALTSALPNVALSAPVPTALPSQLVMPETSLSQVQSIAEGKPAEQAAKLAVVADGTALKKIQPGSSEILAAQNSAAASGSQLSPATTSRGATRAATPSVASRQAEVKAPARRPGFFGRMVRSLAAAAVLLAATLTGCGGDGGGGGYYPPPTAEPTWHYSSWYGQYPNGHPRAATPTYPLNTQHEADLMDELNWHRYDNYEPTLIADWQMADEARGNAIHMNYDNYWSTWNLEGEGPGDRYWYISGINPWDYEQIFVSGWWITDAAAALAELGADPWNHSVMHDPSWTWAGVGRFYNDVTGDYTWVVSYQR